MRIPEAARRLGVADADIRDVTKHEQGYEVRAWTGAHWLLTDDGRLFAMDDHPGTKNLSRWTGSDEQRAPVYDDSPAEPTQEPAVRDLGIEEVPQGKVSEIIEWVGTDKNRAQRALEVEEASDAPRRNLVTQLKRVKES